MNDINKPLTPRQLEMLEYISRGLTNGDIAKVHEISVKTVEAHRTRLFERLGARNAGHAVRIAFERGLLRVSEATEPVVDPDAVGGGDGI